MLYESIKRLTKNSFLYALGPAVHKAIGFLILPLVTVWIGSTGNMGVFVVASTTLVIAGQLLGLNVLSGMTRYYADYPEEERGEVVMTTLVVLLLSTGAALVLCLLLDEQGARLLFGSEEYADVVVAVGAILFCQTMGLVGLRYLQVLQRPISYGVLTTVKLVTELGFKVWFMAFLGLTYMGMLYSVLVGEALLAVGTLVLLLRRIGLRFSREKARRLVRYSYPLILGGVSMFALHQADRFFVQRIRGLDETGLYGIAYQLGSIVNLVVLEAFGMIWFPFVFALKVDEEIRLVCRKVLTYFAVLMCFTSLAIAVFSPELVREMTDETFWGIESAVPVILLGYVFWAIYQVVHTGFFLKERTGRVSLLVTGAAALNVLLNVTLIPRMGYMGAAWATLLTFATLALAAWLLVERLYPIGFEVGRVASAIALAVGLYAASVWIPQGPLAMVLAVKASLVIAFPALLVVGGFLAPEEGARIKAILASVRERLR